MNAPPPARPRAGRLLPALGLVLLSPLCAESLSGYDVSTGNPLALLAGLLILGPLYGCPALLIRELARRHDLRWPGLLVATVLYLAAAALILGSHLKTEDDHASAAQISATLLVVGLLVVGAFTLGRRPAPARHERAQVPPPYAVGLLSLVGALGFNFLPPTWPGFAGGVALLATSAGLLTYVSRSTRWDGRYPVAVAGGAVLAMAGSAFLVTPLGNVPPLPKYTHNTLFLLGSLALLWWAGHRCRQAIQPRRLE